VLFGEHLPGTEENLAHLPVAQEPLHNHLFLFSKAARDERSAIADEPGERVVDAKAAFDSRLDVCGAQRRVHFFALGGHDGTLGKIGRHQPLVIGRPRILGTVVVSPAEFGLFGIRDGNPDRACHPRAETFQRALLVGPQQNRQTFHGPGRGDIEEVGRFFGFLLLNCRSRLCDRCRSGYRTGGEKGHLIFAQAERTAVVGMGNLGHPVEPLFPEEKNMGKFQALGAMDRGQLHPAGMLSLGYGDESRHREQVTQEVGHIAGLGTVEVTFRLVPQRLDEDAREKRQEAAQGGDKNGKTVRVRRLADCPGKPHDGSGQWPVIIQGIEAAGDEGPVMAGETGDERKPERCPLAHRQELAATDPRGGNTRFCQRRCHLVHLHVGATQDRYRTPGATEGRSFFCDGLDEPLIGRIVAGAASNRDNRHLGKTSVGILRFFRRRLKVDFVGSREELRDQMVEKFDQKRRRTVVVGQRLGSDLSS